MKRPQLKFLLAGLSSTFLGITQVAGFIWSSSETRMIRHRSGASHFSLPQGLAEQASKSGVSDHAVEMTFPLFSEVASCAWDQPPSATMFLDPTDYHILSNLLNKLSDIHVRSFGGYSGANRRRLLVSRSEVEDSDEVCGELVSALEIQGDFLFQPAGPSSFASSMIEILTEQHQRGLIGDIIQHGSGELGAQVVVGSEIVEYICENLKTVEGVPVTVSRIQMDELRVRTPSTKQIKSVEASLRIDALGSAGLGVSRSKVASLVKKDKSVLLNWRPATSASTKVKVGDTISVLGKGQVEINSIEVTAKGRYRVEMTRVA